MEVMSGPQFRAIETFASTSARDCLALMATGSGKTEIFLIAGLVFLKLRDSKSLKGLIMIPLLNLCKQQFQLTQAAGIGAVMIDDIVDLRACMLDPSIKLCTFGLEFHF